MIPIILALAFSIFVAYISYKIVQSHGFKGAFIYNIIVNTITVIIEVYANLNLSVIIVSIIIIAITALINTFIQIWAYKVSSSFIGYLLITILLSAVIRALIEIFVNPLIVKFITWILMLIL